MTTVYTSGPWGTTTSHTQGPSGPSGHTTAVNGLTIWADSGNNVIYGITLTWPHSISVNYGNTGTGVSDVSTFGLPAIDQIVYYLAGGYFVGVEMYQNNNGQNFVIGDGNIGGTAGTAFNGTNYAFSDIQVWTKTLSGIETIVGITFYYYDPPGLKMYRMPSEMAFPALGVMANMMVVAKALKRVSRLRCQLNVQASSGEPPTGTDPNKVALWHRTCRAQENGKEFLLFSVPAIAIAAYFGYEAFGSWVPRTVGALSLAGAFLRYRYMKAYIADGETKRPPFRNAMWTMKPIHYMAVASCGYLVGKKLYCHFKDYQDYYGQKFGSKREKKD